MAKVKRYKSTRKYRCPYCRITATRDRLVSHIQDEHEDMLPEGYSAARALYDHINKKNYGTCLICKKNVYEWDETICRYKTPCDNPSCMAQLKARSAKNHLEDPEVQKKLLAGRRISGHYKFKDGTIHSYVGSYERNCFEFMDQVLNIEGKDIMSPGPTIYYEWHGEKHPWILDWMYIPAMLCADVKDGGSNPNNRPMEDYREKQLAKEEAIAKLGKYNYIRLTDNNFAQLLEALANIRMGTINHDPLNHIYINESSYYARPDKELDRYFGSDEEEDEPEDFVGTRPILPDVYSPGVAPSTSATHFNYEAVGGMPSNRAHNDYIIPRMMGGLDFEDRSGMYFGNTGWSKLLHFDAEENPHWEDKQLALMPLVESYRIVFKNSNILGSLSENEIKSLGEDGLISKMMGRPYKGLKDLLMTEGIASLSQETDNDLARALITNGIVSNIKHVINEAYTDKKIIQEEFIESKDNVSIYKDDEGYYLTTPDDFLLTSNHYPAYTDIPEDMITLMNDMYKNRRREDPFNG